MDAFNEIVPSLSAAEGRGDEWVTSVILLLWSMEDNLKHLDSSITGPHCVKLQIKLKNDRRIVASYYAVSISK
jgi:hypothetical protein